MVPVLKIPNRGSLLSLGVMARLSKPRWKSAHREYHMGRLVTSPVGQARKGEASIDAGTLV